MDPILPPWAAQLRDRYVGGESSVFLLHGNTRDEQPWPEPDGTVRYIPLRTFLERLFSRSKDMVAYYNVSEGLCFPTKAMQTAFQRTVNTRRIREGREELVGLPGSISAAVDAIEDLVTEPSARAAVVLDYVETILPNGDLSFMAEVDKANLVRLLHLGSDPGLAAGDSVVVLVTETLADVNRRLVASSHIAALEVPLPGPDERAAFLRAQDRRDIQFEISEDQLSKVTAGLTLIQIRGLLRNARQSKAPLSFALVNQRKKTIIEQECHGLVEFVDPGHDFSHVGGMDGVKAELLRVAEAVKKGVRNRVPMGAIFVGPMGTGKTFVAEAFAKESGLTCLKFKNFREKWVGSTEANLERILRVVDGLGYVLLIIDEADRSLGNQGDSDGGTSSRVIARLKEFMSDTDHRGRVLILMMTNRPDKLDTDLKRPGRFDLKIPFFFPETVLEREHVLAAVGRRSGLKLADGIRFTEAAAQTAGYSAAELEAVMLAAANFSAWEDRDTVSPSDLSQAVKDVVPSRDVRMLDYMEMLAVFESSSRRMLPERFASLSTDEVLARLDLLRAQLGPRAA